MLLYTASTEIYASPETIWGILTDAAKYPEWDLGMIKLDGKIAAGEKLSILAKVSPNRAFTPSVTVFEPNHKMVWSSRMPMGLFSGERTFILTPHSDHVHFALSEEFKGLLLPLIGRSIPNMEPIFQTFCAALKSRAESISAS